MTGKGGDTQPTTNVPGTEGTSETTRSREHKPGGPEQHIGATTAITDKRRYPEFTVGSLCTGIGGIDLGLERAGWAIRWQSEIDPYCARVLTAHWPKVPNLGDMTAIDWENDGLDYGDGIARSLHVDLICAGYPCQPFAYAGRRRGADDPRHLWPAVRDAIRALRPRWALLENVPGHLGLGFDAVLADLAALGFDAEWSLVPACALGAPHLRERLFCVAYAPGGDGEGEMPHHPRAGTRRRFQPRGGGSYPRPDRWLPEPAMDRVAHGIPSKLVRAPLHALGNTVVPQVAEWVGRRIMAAA